MMTIGRRKPTVLEPDSSKNSHSYWKNTVIFELFTEFINMVENGLTFIEVIENIKIILVHHNQHKEHIQTIVMESLLETTEIHSS